MTADQWITLAGHIAWPVAVFVGLIVLPFYMGHIAKLAGLVEGLKNLLEKKSELLNLVSKISELKEALSTAKGELKDLGLNVDAIRDTLNEQRSQKRDPLQEIDADALLKSVREDWDQVRVAISDVVESKEIASKSNITPDDVRDFKKSTGTVQKIADALTDLKVIDRDTSALMTDLSSQFQLWTRSRNRDALLNKDVVSDFSTKVASLIKTLKNVRVQ